MMELPPPRAAQVEYVHEKFGDRRSDPYHWMRERENPQVRQHLELENAYARSQLKSTASLQKEILSELKSRVPPEDSSAPVRIGKFFYQWEYQSGAEHPRFVRRAHLKTGRREVLLDVPKLARGHAYFQVAAVAVSPDTNLLAYAVDLSGRRLFETRIRDLKKKRDLPIRLENTSGSLAWASDSKAFFYVRKDPETLRAFQVYRHRLDEAPSEDPVASGKRERLIFEEKDTSFQVSVSTSITRRVIFLESSATLTSEWRWFAADDPDCRTQLFLAREKGHEYSLEEAHGKFWIQSNWKAPDGRLFTSALQPTEPKDWTEIRPARPATRLERFLVLEKALVVEERKKGLLGLSIIPIQKTGVLGAEKPLKAEHEAYSMSLGANREFDLERVRFVYETPILPAVEYDWVLSARKKILVKKHKVPNFSSSRYQVRRLWFKVRDGTEVPVTVVALKKLRDLSRQPLLVYGYGSYGLSMDPDFSFSVFSLVDRGFVYATAHIRGGQELGRQWYDEGKLLNKKNTFTDFIDVTEALVKDKIGDPNNLYAMGGSAGGMLMGVVANMRPDLYRGIVALVPFVDNLTTMLDESIPLTTFEYDEWGNPNQEKFYRYIKSYSVFDNVEKQNYPAIFVRTGFHDSQVQYWEPMKWVARLRDLNQSSNPILFLTEMDAGHSGKSGRYQALTERALDYAFLLGLWKGKISKK